MFGIDRNEIEIFISDKFLEEYISKWLNCKNGVKKNIGKILLGLDVCKKGDYVYLHGYNKVMGSFDVIVGRDGHYLDEEIKISFINEGKENNPKVVVVKGKIGSIYECLRDSRGRISEEYNLIEVKENTDYEELFGKRLVKKMYNKDGRI